MLIELDISNLAVIDHARIAFGPGLNALTGETGAGKSIVIDAVGLLVGGRADAGMIRSGAPGARVEGIFQASAIDLASLEEGALAAPGDDVLILARELASSGRNVCRINGRAVPLRMLQEWMGHANYQTTLIYADYAPDPSQGTVWARRAFGARASQGE